MTCQCNIIRHHKKLCEPCSMYIAMHVTINVNLQFEYVYIQCMEKCMHNTQQSYMLCYSSWVVDMLSWPTVKHFLALHSSSEPIRIKIRDIIYYISYNNLKYILYYKIIDQDFACIMFTLHILHACYLHCCTCVYCRARPFGPSPDRVT